MSTGLRRCFLGIALPEAVRGQLAAWCAANRTPALDGTWVKAENFHITLRFLGDLDDVQRHALDRRVADAFGKCQAAGLRLADVGAFPDARRPRVLWAGAEILDGALEPLFEAAESGARAIGLPPETRPAAAHVTLLRLRIPPRGGLPRTLLDAGRAFVSDAFEARAVALWESTPGPGGARYAQLKEYPLT